MSDHARSGEEGERYVSDMASSSMRNVRSIFYQALRYNNLVSRVVDKTEEHLQ